jgi:hypothetical protein
MAFPSDAARHNTRRDDMRAAEEATPLLVTDADSPSRGRRGGMPWAILAAVVGLVRIPSPSPGRG